MAPSPDLLDGAGAALIAGVGGVIGWLTKRWLAELGSKVDSRADDLESHLDAQAIRLGAVDGKLADTRESLTEVRGHLGMAHRAALVVEERCDLAPREGDRRAQTGK